jgi:hypothetical protein
MFGMSIDIANEKLITPAEYVLRWGVHISTFYRHAFKGTDGVHLEIVKLGGRTYTSLEAVQRFADRLTQAKTGVPADASIRTPAARIRADVKAERELEQLGV